MSYLYFFFISMKLQIPEVPCVSFSTFILVTNLSPFNKNKCRYKINVPTIAA